MFNNFRKAPIKSGLSAAMLTASAAYVGTKKLQFGQNIFRDPALAASAAEEKAKMDKFLSRELDKVFAMQDYTNPDMLE